MEPKGPKGEREGRPVLSERPPLPEIPEEVVQKAEERLDRIDRETDPLVAAAAGVPAPPEGAPREGAAPDGEGEAAPRKLAAPAKIFGVLCILVGVVAVPLIVAVVIAFVRLLASGETLDDADVVSGVLLAAEIVVNLAIFGMAFVLGIQLLRDRRRRVATQAYVLAFAVGASAILDIMNDGLTWSLLFDVGFVVVFVALSSYADPALAGERQLQRKLRSMEDRYAAESGTLGRDATGEGYISLNFFNLFWIFVVACVLGDVIETVYHMAVIDPGQYQNRTGLLYGPFSPIYGVGALLMTMALNRFYKSNIVLIFVVSAVIGGGFEYLVSWFMQFAFGIQAWDYSGTFGNIGGRTNVRFMCMWGALGVFWIKLILPRMLEFVNLIPWNMRYVVTTVCAALMFVNATMTLVSLDRWYERLADQPPETFIEQFADDHYGNTFMQNRFQTMTIDPDSALRQDG